MVISLNTMMSDGVLTLDPYQLTLPPSIQILLLKNFMPGTCGGSGMVKFCICLSHACHQMHMCNFLELETVNHNVVPLVWFTQNLFDFLAALIFILLQSHTMNLLHFIVLPLVLGIILHVGSLVLTN